MVETVEHNVVVSQVPAERVKDVWRYAEGILERAVERSLGQALIGDLRKMLECGDRQLWIMVRDGKIAALCLTRMMDQPTMRVMYVSHFVGTLEDIPVMWPHVKRAAKAWGCKMVMQEGRPGFGRSGALPPEFRHSFDVWVAEV